MRNQSPEERKDERVLGKDESKVKQKNRSDSVCGCVGINNKEYIMAQLGLPM